MAGKSRSSSTLLIRDYILEQRAAHRTWRSIGEDLGCSHVQVQNIANDRGGAGFDTEQAYANLKFNGSVDALRRAAELRAREKAAAPPAVPHEDPIERSLASAIEKAAAAGEFDLVAKLTAAMQARATVHVAGETAPRSGTVEALAPVPHLDDSDELEVVDQGSEPGAPERYRVPEQRNRVLELVIKRLPDRWSAAAQSDARRAAAKWDGPAFTEADAVRLLNEAQADAKGKRVARPAPPADSGFGPPRGPRRRGKK